MRDDFAIIIPSYDRYDVLEKHTLKMLNKYNYSGRWYVVVDDSDPQLEKYKKQIPESHLFVFNKKEHHNGYDEFYNKDIDCKLCALHYIQTDLVYKLNIKYYMLIDDDIADLMIRKPYNNKLLSKGSVNGEQFEKTIEYYLEFLKNTHYNNISFCSEYEIHSGVNDKIFTQGYLHKILSIYLIEVNNVYPFYSIFEEEIISTYLNGLHNIYAISFPYLFFKTLQSYIENEKRNDGGNSYLYNKFTNTRYLTIMCLLMCRPSSILRINYNRKGRFGIDYIRDSRNIYPMVIDGRWKK